MNKKTASTAGETDCWVPMQTEFCRWMHKFPDWPVKFRMQPLLRVAIRALQTLQSLHRLKTQGCYC